jgi:hypothetical protein
MGKFPRGGQPQAEQLTENPFLGQVNFTKKALGEKALATSGNEFTDNPGFMALGSCGPDLRPGDSSRVAEGAGRNGRN